MNEPLVSVIMPAYKCASTIRAAIDSVLLQNVPLELLVIDDCSPEPLDEVLDPYRNEERVRIYRNEQNLGAAASRNRGVTLARAPYIAFLDADDIWKPEKLEKQVSLLEETGIALCATGRELMDPNGRLTGRVIPVPERITYRELLKHNCINCSSVVMRTEVAREFPMEHEDAHEDYIMWLRVMQKYQYACGINEPLLKYRLTNTGKSGSKLHSAQMTFRVYRCMGFGLCKSAALFASYAVHGVMKYALSYLGDRK